MVTPTQDEKELEELVPIGAIFRHFKGKDYKVLHIVRHSETLELMVVYQALYDSPEFGPFSLWVRPLSLFLEIVEVDGKTIPRFSLTHEPGVLSCRGFTDKNTNPSR